MENTIPSELKELEEKIQQLLTNYNELKSRSMGAEDMQKKYQDLQQQHRLLQNQYQSVLEDLKQMRKSIADVMGSLGEKPDNSQG